MKNSPLFHDTFTLERHFKASVAKVFEAFRKPELKRQWFRASDDRYQVSEQSLDFRVGGREVLRGQFPSGTTTSYEAYIYDIVENERIVYAYDLLINEQRFSVTLVTVQFRAEKAGTLLLFTEQNTFVNSPADANASKQAGVSWHLENLATLLGLESQRDSINGFCNK